MTVCLMTLIGTFGISMALLQKSTEVKENVITAGKVDIKLEEPAWDPSVVTSLRPDERIRKDPCVTNIGVTDARIYLAVQIPYLKGAVVDPKTKRKVNAAKSELFTFLNVSAKWTLISKEEQSDSVTYLYAYNTVLKPSEKTEALFQAVQMADYLEGSLDPEKTNEILVQAMAIQSEMNLKDPKEIYAMYQKQIQHDKQAG